jgi:small subunit ribosomal protein S17
MADATDNEAPDAGDGQTPEVEGSEAPSAEAPASDAPAQPDAPDVSDTDAEAPPEAQPPTPAHGAGSGPAEQLSPKERRRRKRSRHSGEVRPARSPQERHAERLLKRRAKALKRRARRLQERAKAAERRAGAPASEPLAPVQAPIQGARRVRQGVVVSDRAQKTITVRIDVARRHSRYEKIVRGSGTLHAHDEHDEAHVGDVVRVIESRPLSRTKRWTLVDVVERAR